MSEAKIKINEMPDRYKELLDFTQKILSAYNATPCEWDHLESIVGGTPGLSQYKTEPKDYTGCHSVIAEALMQGLNIWCKVMQSNERRIIRDYILLDSHYWYVGFDGDIYKSAEPMKKEEV